MKKIQCRNHYLIKTYSTMKKKQKKLGVNHFHSEFARKFHNFTETVSFNDWTELHITFWSGKKVHFLWNAVSFITKKKTFVMWHSHKNRFCWDYLLFTFLLLQIKYYWEYTEVRYDMLFHITDTRWRYLSAASLWEAHIIAHNPVEWKKSTCCIWLSRVTNNSVIFPILAG